MVEINHRQVHSNGITLHIAEAELQADVRQSLRRFFYSLSADAPPEVVTYLYTSKPADAGVLDGMPDPPVLPAWLTDADLDYYACAFERAPASAEHSIATAIWIATGKNSPASQTS